MTRKATRLVAPAAGHLDGSHLQATIAGRLFRRLDSLLGLDMLVNLVARSPETSAETLDQGTHPEMDRTQLAGTRTNLALMRNVLAAERTLMAWIRTCLAMISFGFTIGKLENVLASAKVNVAFGRTADIAGVAYFLVCLGTVALILAAVQYRFEVAGLTPHGLKRRPSLAFAMAVLISLLGMFVFTDMVTRL